MSPSLFTLLKASLTIKAPPPLSNMVHQKSQFFAVTAVTLCVAFVLTIACGLTVTTSTSAQQTPKGLTPQEKRGKALYLRGESRSGKEITAMLGEIDVPASTMNCAGCHGLRGEGTVSYTHLTLPT